MRSKSLSVWMYLIDETDPSQAWSVRVTPDGAIAIQSRGTTLVKTAEEWLKAARGTLASA